MTLSFYIDCIGSLINWKIIKKGSQTIAQYQISRFETYAGRRFSMDACILYENSILGVYEDYIPNLKPNDWVIDVGAHIGSFSIHLARRFPKLRIVSIEPHPINFELLTNNIGINNLTSTIQPLHAAVGKRNGRASLYEDFGNTAGGSIHNTSSNTIRYKTKLTTLANLFTTYHIPRCEVLKLDCEGAEYEILRSTPSGVLKWIQTIIMEINEENRVADLTRYLTEQGFSVTMIPNAITHPLLKHLFTDRLCIATRKPECNGENITTHS